MNSLEQFFIVNDMFTLVTAILAFLARRETHFCVLQIWFDLDLDCNYVFLIVLVPNKILFVAHSIRRLLLQSLFDSKLQDSELDLSVCVIRLHLGGVWAKIANYPCLNTFGMLSVGENSIDERDRVVFGNKFLSVNVLNYCFCYINNRYSYYRYAVLCI